jgi:hypothetical protein
MLRILEYLSDCWFLKNDSAPCSWLVSWLVGWLVGIEWRTVLKWINLRKKIGCQVVDCSVSSEKSLVAVSIKHFNELWGLHKKAGDFLTI